MGYYLMEENCKSSYVLNNDKIIFEDIKIDHDGYDQYGPESNLYDYLIILQRNNKILYEIFHREYWFHGEDDQEYYPFCSQIPFENNVVKILNEYEKIPSEDIAELENIVSQLDMVEYLRSRKTIFEWWEDKKIINILKNKTSINYDNFLSY